MSNISYIGDLVDRLNGLVTAGGIHLTTGTNLFEDYQPDNPVTSAAIIDTGGSAANPELPTHHFPTFQAWIRADTKQNAKDIALAIRDALHGLQGVTLGDKYFHYIQLITEGGPTGKDPNGNQTYSLNFQARYYRIGQAG